MLFSVLVGLLSFLLNVICSIKVHHSGVVMLREGVSVCYDTQVVILLQLHFELPSIVRYFYSNVMFCYWQ